MIEPYNMHDIRGSVER